MPNQRAIAAFLDITQAAVSRALRGDPHISDATRRRVKEAADKLGYRPNAAVSSLMARIRSGRPVSGKGCIAVLVDSTSEHDPFGRAEAYLRHRAGMSRRAEELGFRTECFYLRSPGMTSKRLDGILRARGISGLILTPPRHSQTKRLDLEWERYAMATIAYEWPLPIIDRVTTHHRHNVQLSFAKLFAQGYRRVGMCLPPEGVAGVDSNWKAGFLLMQDDLPPDRRIPLFVGKPGRTPAERFHAWMDRWRPDALVCLIGHETKWLKERGGGPPDPALVCVNRPLDSAFSGVEENHEVIGATTIELVVTQILHNELGPPRHPKLILVEGTWVPGKTIPGAAACPVGSPPAVPVRRDDDDAPPNGPAS